MSRFVTALILALSIAPSGFGQGPDPLKPQEKAVYDQLKRGEEKLDDPKNKAIMAKQAKYLVGQLNEPDRINRDVLASVVQQAIQDLPIQKSVPRGDVAEAQIAFNQAMGQVMVAELLPLLKSQKLVVRVNAARMLSVVAQLGSDEVAEPALAILADKKETDAVKHFAIMTLGNLFAYVTEPNVPWKSAFRKEKAEAERKAIVALCDFILRKPDTKEMNPDQIRGLHFVRREAVKALGFVRMHRLRFQGEVLAKPGWVLLKVANCDGIEPVPEPLERSMAIYSFTQLFPVTRANVDRDINLEFAADRIGAPLLELVTIKANPPPGAGPAIAAVPWIYFANVWEMGLNLWQTNAKASNLNGAAAVTTLYERAKTDLLEQLKKPDGVPPNVNAFQQWFDGTRTKAEQLYTDDPSSTVKAIK